MAFGHRDVENAQCIVSTLAELVGYLLVVTRSSVCPFETSKFAYSGGVV